MDGQTRLSPLERLFAAFFTAALVAVLFFMAYRIVQKPRYEAEQSTQCTLLAVSDLEFFISKAGGEPAAPFGEDNELKIDHMSMPGNWVVKLQLVHEGNAHMVRSTASSGWNSRSPASAAFEALFDESGDIRYVENPEPEVLDLVRSASAGRESKRVEFKLPYDKEPPMRLEARAASADFMGKSYLVIK
jgi:hypothetical protein